MTNNAFVFNPNDSAYSFMSNEIRKFSRECIREAFIQEAIELHGAAAGNGDALVAVGTKLLLPSSLEDIFTAVQKHNDGQSK